MVRLVSIKRSGGSGPFCWNVFLSRGVFINLLHTKNTHKMGTHSRIGKLLPDGKVRSVYCHYDGYVQGGVGEDLLNHYQDESKIDALLDLGNLSGIAKEIGEKQDFNDLPNLNMNWCLSYGRDRGQKGQEATVAESEEAYLREENCSYIYLYKNGEWWFSDVNQDRYSGLQTISSAFNIKEEDENE